MMKIVESATTKQAAPSWRDVLKVHPAAEASPLMGRDELLPLGADIKKHGLKSPIVFWSPGAEGGDNDQQKYLLDGRNRLEAMTVLGLEVIKDGLLNPAVLKKFGPLPITRLYGKRRAYSGAELPGVDPCDYVLSVNVHRRHLTPAQKSEAIERLLTLHPEKSNRQIAEATKSSHVTVGAKRAKMESTGQVDQLKKTVGADGKSRPTKKKSRAADRPVINIIDRADEQKGSGKRLLITAPTQPKNEKRKVLGAADFLVAELSDLGFRLRLSSDPAADVAAVVEAVPDEQCQKFETAIDSVVAFVARLKSALGERREHKHHVAPKARRRQHVEGRRGVIGSAQNDR